jgi:hypothetical protein
MVQVHHKSNPELGTHSIRRRDKDRTAVFKGSKVKKTAKTTDPGQKPGPGGFSGDGPDLPHQAIRRVDIDTGTLVGYFFARRHFKLSDSMPSESKSDGPAINPN